MKTGKRVPLGAGSERIDEICREVIAGRPAPLGKKSLQSSSCESPDGESGEASLQVPVAESGPRERPLSKRAFMKASGLTYPKCHELWSDPSFPLVAGLVYWSDFVWWRRRKR